MIILLVLLIIFILLELYTLLLSCRRGHGAWKYLKLWRYAHRGYHDKPQVPENSMAAFRRAADNHFGAELDVHLMRDGHLAVIHDSNLKRTAGVDVAVEDLTVEELKQYRLEGTDETIPLLEEVLPLFEGKSPLIVELKSERGNYDELTQATAELLDRYSVLYCIESFDPRCLRWLKKNRPEIVRGQLSGNLLRDGQGSDQSKATLFLLSHLLLNFMGKPDFIAYNCLDRSNWSLQWCRKFYKVQEISWTLRSKEELQRVEADGCLSIFETFDPRGV
ncbi:MAG: glycerophosphodiester phosphodiesterase [Clostridiales bacterium]|nr:glycerophosphodiester phosphodiesterase [Candidatus Cacconaster stercorequi]